MYTRKKVDTDYRLRCLLRSRLASVINKYSQTGKILSSKQYGINYTAIIEHLKPFPKQINKYHVDHIKPLCSFNLNDPEQIRLAFAPENHQWLLAEENQEKKNHDGTLEIQVNRRWKK
ncbi:hypothetical protein M0R04_09575 [Candidatus Dojkabacteria bacterium]|jgi:hypothetical protein|nr:hypothetical protein [Candidatus Dojkabacteria bacterium]